MSVISKLAEYSLVASAALTALYVYSHRDQISPYINSFYENNIPEGIGIHLDLGPNQTISWTPSAEGIVEVTATQLSSVTEADDGIVHTTPISTVPIQATAYPVVPLPQVTPEVNQQVPTELEAILANASEVTPIINLETGEIVGHASKLNSSEKIPVIIEEVIQNLSPQELENLTVKIMSVELPSDDKNGATMVSFKSVAGVKTARIAPESKYVDTSLFMQLHTILNKDPLTTKSLINIKYGGIINLTLLSSRPFIQSSPNAPFDTDPKWLPSNLLHYCDNGCGNATTLSLTK